MFRKEDPKKELRTHQRELRRTDRHLERDRRDLERQEKQLEAEIKKCAQRGDKSGATRLAKQLVQLRKQRDRSLAASSQINSIRMQATTMHSTSTLATSMGAATKAMGAMNAQINLPELQKTMHKFATETEKMDMTEEMMNDTLDAIFDDSDAEEETDSIMSQVLDEIGIDLKGQMVSAPKTGMKQAAAAEADEDDIIRRMEALSAPTH